jgi:hypothetical protein
MVAPKGNKFAQGNPNSGRPCKFNKEEEFKALFEWAQTDQALVFRMFPCSRGYSHDTLEDWAKQKEEFLDIYNISKEMVGARRELRLLLSDSPSPFQRYATYYDKKLHAHERSEKEFESSLRKDEEGSKATTIHLTASDDLTAGLNISTKTISSKDNKGSK